MRKQWGEGVRRFLFGPVLHLSDDPKDRIVHTGAYHEGALGMVW